MKHTVDKTLSNFATKVMNASSLIEAQEVVNEIIFAAAYDSDLVDEVFKNVNAKLDWAAAIERVQSNMSEF